MKKLIKRLEEQAVEIERLSIENSELRKRLRKHEPRIVGYEWYGGGIKPGKCSLIYDGEDLLQEENKELQEAIEILKDWRFGKCTYSSDEIDRAIETILIHLEK